ncbi:MAG TPA: condensation domain-containing protein, partial [Nitrospira sp.]|nr:condensation domain-containing protein [Nitrospira sp.]
VGRHDHFFELGGHSLLVVTLIERLRQQGLIVDVRTVFTAPTLEALAAVITDTHLPPTVVVPPNAITTDCTGITPDLLPLVQLTQAEIDSITASVPQGVTNIQDIYPLAPLQEGILFHHLLQTEGDAYLLRSVMAFDTRHRLDAFLDALQIVINRHDILRTAIRWTGLTQPVQVVLRQATLPVTELTLATTSDATQQLLALTDPRHLRLDVQRAPLVAAYLAHDPQTHEWLLALLNHHIVCDHLTLEFIITEIHTLLQGQGETLPASMAYRNFIAQTQAVSPAAHEAYFRQQLGDIDAPTAPFGVLNVQGDGNQVTDARMTLSDDLARRIRRTARQRGVSAAVLFHVAWAQVVAQCSDRDDVVFGTVLSGRLQGSAEADRVLGMFINTLPVRISLADRSVQQVVTDTYQRLSELLVHEQASLVLAQRCSGVTAPLPLFTTLLNYRHSQEIITSAAATSAWNGMRVLAGEERTNYPIAISVDDLGHGFALEAQCVLGVDSQRIATYLQTAVEALVTALSNNPQQRVRALDILPIAERQQLLIDFNDTAVAYPQE